MSQVQGFFRPADFADHLVLMASKFEFRFICVKTRQMDIHIQESRNISRKARNNHWKRSRALRSLEVTSKMIHRQEKMLEPG